MTTVSRAGPRPVNIATLYGIQHLRALAALLVVFHHVNNKAMGLYAAKNSLSFGMAGVDIFFVISGFIMLYITRDRILSPLDFFLRRLLRILPVYWITTILAGLAINFAPYFFSGETGWETLIKSLLFIPTEPPAGHAYATPTVAVGWTLNLEMMFYALLAVSLFARRNYVFVTCVLVITLCCLSFGVYGKAPKGGFGMYSFQSGVMLEFLLGMSLAFFLPKSEEIWPPLGIAISAIGFALLVYTWPIAGGARLLSAGFPSMLIVGGFLISEPVWRFSALSRRLKIVGDASYSIYATHLFLVIPGARFAREHAAWVVGHVPIWAFTIVMMFGCTLLGIAFHLAVEKPIGRWLHREAVPRPQPEPVAVAA